MQYRAKYTVKVGGEYRVPGEPSECFEWDTEWGSPEGLVTAGLIEAIEESEEPAAAEEAEDFEETAEESDEGGPLAGIDFASDEAAEAAEEHGLTSEDFEGWEPSGAGGYTKRDVLAIAAAVEAAEAEQE